MSEVTPAAIDEWSKHILHVSQHSSMVIGLAGRLQGIANEMRATAGLPEFGRDDFVRDEIFQQCSVHVEGCAGQHTHLV